jgi:CBS domain-containing protein
MRPDFPALVPELPIRRAVAQLVEARAAAAPVLGGDRRLCGILTQKDCFRPVLHASYYQEWRGSVGDYMTSSVVTIDAEEEAIAAAEMFLAHPYRVIPVLSGATLAGMLYRSDLLALLTRAG